MSTNKLKAKLAGLIRSRTPIKSNITKLITFFDTNPEIYIHDIQNQKAILRDYLSKFESRQDEIDKIAEKLKEDNLIKKQETERDDFNDKYYSCDGKMRRLINKIILNQRAITASILAPTPHISNQTINCSFK